MDRALWHIVNSGQWSEWESLGGALPSTATVTASAADRLDVFVRGTDNALWRLQYTGQWSNWQPQGGVLAYDPVAAASAAQRVDIFVRGTDNALWHNANDGQWHSWESLGGGLTSDPAAVGWPQGRLDVFARGTDNALWHIWHDGQQWFEWERLGGVLMSSPAAVGWGQGRLDVFARGTDRALWHTWYDGQWNQWESLGGILTADPAVAASGSRMDVFVRGTDSALWHASYEGHWNPWESLGGGAESLLDISRSDGSPWINPRYDTSDPNWSTNVVGGHTLDGSASHAFEWVSVLRPTVEQDDQVGLAGTVIHPHESENDVPFTHPFGLDYEFSIIPDPAYDDLLATANKDPSGTYQGSWEDSNANGIIIPTGVLGLEIDKALVAAAFRPISAERVAVYGRWIVDAGHGDFHAEIHPPLLMGFARSVDNSDNPALPDENATTLFRLWSRPYQAGQLFTSDGESGLPLQDYCRRIMLTPGEVRAFPPVFPRPFDGQHLVSFTIRPPVPVPPLSSATWDLQYSYHFTVNQCCNVDISRSPQQPNALLVTVSLNAPLYPVVGTPAEQFDTFGIDDLLRQVPSGLDLSWYVQLWLDIKQAQGPVSIRRFDAPQSSSTQDSVNVVPFTSINAPSMSGQALDVSQPFPVYGWVRLRWVRTGG
jgi:hypothetical protein